MIGCFFPQICYKFYFCPFLALKLISHKSSKKLKIHKWMVHKLEIKYKKNILRISRVFKKSFQWIEIDTVYSLRLSSNKYWGINILSLLALCDRYQYRLQRHTIFYYQVTKKMLMQTNLFNVINMALSVSNEASVVCKRFVIK